MLKLLVGGIDRAAWKIRCLMFVPRVGLTVDIKPRVDTDIEQASMIAAVYTQTRLFLNKNGTEGIN